MPSGLRTLEHVRWAYALVKRDIDSKMRVAYSNCATQAQDALSSKILSMVTGEHGETLGAIQRGCRAYKPADVEQALERMVQAGALVKRDSTGRGRPTSRYFVR
jgi:predicted RNA-binding protein Jag